MKVKEYYGTRAHCGLIYISSSNVMAPECYAMAPEGVSVNTTRMQLPEVTVKGLRAIMDGDKVWRGTRELACAPPHSICFGGTSATFIESIGWDKKVCDRMNGVSNDLSCTTTSTAMLAGLKAVGAKKVSFVTPYLDEVTESSRIFLEPNGFTVVSSEGLNIRDDLGIGAVKTQRTYDFMLEKAKP